MKLVDIRGISLSPATASVFSMPCVTQPQRWIFLCFSPPLVMDLGKKVMTNLDSILKSRDITLPTKVRLVKAMVFPLVMYECENWTVKKAERQRIDAFELWCWRRLLRVSWTARRSRRSVLGVLWKE